MENIQAKDITLPVELATGKFTLQEIGAIVVLMCLPSLEEDQVLLWGDSESLKETLNELIDEGVAGVEVIDGVQNLTLDLTI